MKKMEQTGMRFYLITFIMCTFLLAGCCTSTLEERSSFPFEQFKNHLERLLLSYDWATGSPRQRSIRNAGFGLEDYIKLTARYTPVFHENYDSMSSFDYFRDMLPHVDYSDRKFVDINKDGVLEIVVPVAHGNNMERELIIIYKKKDSTLKLVFFPFAELEDIDGDGILELLVLDVLNYGGASGDLTICWEDVHTFDGEKFASQKERYKSYYRFTREYYEGKKREFTEWTKERPDDSFTINALQAVEEVLRRIDAVLER